MTSCRHSHLVLLPQPAVRLRCRYCHLTLGADERKGDYCPECFEAGRKHNDFEKIESPAATRYQCEDCGAIIEYAQHSKP